MTIEIRPGVERPDWSAVKSAAAAEALREREARRPGLVSPWAAGLAESQDVVWRRTLELFAVLGRPPVVVEIAREVKISDESARKFLRDLEERDLAALDDAASIISYAYPLTAQRTEHRVRLVDHVLFALCAVDALGVGAMYGADVLVESACRGCGAEIAIQTARHGTVLADARPGGAMVWYDLAYERNAATSCCPSIAFFCGPRHLREWRAGQAATRIGHELTPAEALEIGRALFGPILRMATADPARQDANDYSAPPARP